MHNPYSQSINLNVNLINFPSPIQLTMNQKMTKFSLHQPKSKNLKNHSLNINKKQSPLFHQNFEDSMEQFHPTMSTESLCKVKKMYEKSMKTKGFGKSLDDFLNADVQDMVRKNSKTFVLKQFNSKDRTQNKLGSRQNTSKSNHNSQNSSKNNSRNSTQHLVSKQPAEIQCYDTFQEDQDFVKFDLLKNSLNANKHENKMFGKDLFKKNKSKGISAKNQKPQTNNFFEPGSHQDFQPFIKSKELKVFRNEQQNKPFLNNVKKSKSKSRSKSKQKSRQKPKQQVLRKLPSAKNIKSTQVTSKQLVSKSPVRHNTSKSPLKESLQSNVHKQKQSSKVNVRKQTKRTQDKSKSKSKNKKKFVRSNIQIQISNHHTFSPSPATKRSSKSKSFQRSRSISNQKSRSKSKRSISKSANQKNIKLNKSKSPKPMTEQKNIVKQFNLKLKDFTQNISREMNKSRSQSKQKHKRSTVNEQKSNSNSKEKRVNKKTNEKQRMTKQFSQRVLKYSEFSKNKFQKVTYAKPDIRTSPDHSRSTNFYLPQRKESIKPKSKAQKELKSKKPLKYGKEGKIKSKNMQKNQIDNQKGLNQDKVHDKQRIQTAVETIQRIYRGYRVRKQLNEDLREICTKVETIRTKIDDKGSRYWINRDQEKQLTDHKTQKWIEENRDKIRKLKDTRDKVKRNLSKVQFQSILSSSNSIQQLNNKTPESYNKSDIKNDQNDEQQDQQMSHSISHSMTMQQNSKSQLIYFEQMVNKDHQQNEKFLRQSEQFKQHIRSISSEHLKFHDHPVSTKNQETNFEKSKNQEKNNIECEKSEKYLSGKDSLISEKQFSIKFSQKEKQKPSSKPPLKVSELGNINPPTFQFYEAYSPKHYILSPRNPSPSVLRMVSPISSASSFYQHNQIPFSLQSPQNILNAENFNHNSNQQNKKEQKKQKYFEAVSQGRNEPSESQENFSQAIQEKEKLPEDVERKIQMLKKLFYENKLISPKTFEKKLNLLKSKNETKDQEKISIETNKQEKKNQKFEEIVEKEKSSVSKKLKITELTEQLNQNGENLSKESVSRALFTAEQFQQPNQNQKFSIQAPQINSIDSHLSHLQEVLEQNLKQRIEYDQRDEQSQEKEQKQDNGQEMIAPVSHRFERYGFSTELIFIKNYIFEFFTFIKSNPKIQKQLLLNLLSLPYDNEHLLTCYRTQLLEIDADYYENRIQGHFLAYPYWKNLIDYQPIVGTDIFQRFSQSLQERTNRNDEGSDEQENDNYFSVTQDQQHRFMSRFRGQRMSLKQIQRIFLMMLMDAFNQAFEEERCSYRQLSLIKHEKGGMNNEHTVRQTLKKIQEIQKLERSVPAYYLEPDQIGSDKTKQFQPHEQKDLQGSQNYQFFIVHSLRQKKQQLIDVIFCSVLKRVLENWGRSMCGLIIEPDEEDEMQITMEQIQVKNTQRLCLALNKYVQEYERQLANVMREHELCTKLIVADKVLQNLLQEVVYELYQKDL